MTTLNIPSSPSQGATYEANGVVYTWDGTKWKADSSNVSNLNGGQLAGFRNQIINGDFRVWQRGTSNAAQTDAGYFSADRWRMSGQTTLDRRTNGPAGLAYVGRVRRASGNRIIYQGIEIEEASNSIPSGSVYTLSYWSDAAIATVNVSFHTTMDSAAVGTVTTAAAVSGETSNGFTHYSHLVTIGAHDNSPTVLRLELSNAADYQITGVQFELGPVATPFEHRLIGTELALCQRYFQNIGTLFFSTNGLTSPAQGGQWSGPIRPEMRTVPTAASTGQNITGDPSYTITSRTFRVYANASSATGTARVNDLTLDAEL